MIADTVELKVKIGGAPLPGPLGSAVLGATVAQAVGQAAHLKLRLGGWDAGADEFGWIDDALFEPGRSVEIGVADGASVFEGEIVSLDLEATAAEGAALTVHAYDYLHRLGRGQRQYTYEKTTYAGIVRKIAKEVYRLDADAKDGDLDPQNPVVYQKNVSDLRFLLGLAEEIGYELFAEGRKLVFRKSRAGDAPQLTLDAASDLVQLSAELRAADQLGGVDVLAFDSDSKKAIKVSEDNKDGADAKYGSVPSRALVAHEPLSTQEQAKARLKAELRRIRDGYLSASGSCFGRTDLKPGMMIRIDKLGGRFGGAYYVTTVTHTLSPAAGFRTRFELKGEPQ